MDTTRFATNEYLTLRTVVEDDRYSYEMVAIFVRNMWPKIKAAILHSEDAYSKEGWRDIETAPRDGTEILLASWCLHDAPGGPFIDCIVAAWDVEEVGGEGGWATDGGLAPIDGDPTHWMPLPAPPSLNPQQREGEP